MTWNYRIMKHSHRSGDFYAIHECFMNSKGQVHSWTEDEVAPLGETAEELIETLEMMLKDAKAYGVLDYSMEPEGKDD